MNEELALFCPFFRFFRFFPVFSIRTDFFRFFPVFLGPEMAEKRSKKQPEMGRIRGKKGPEMAGNGRKWAGMTNSAGIQDSTGFFGSGPVFFGFFRSGPVFSGFPRFFRFRPIFSDSPDFFGSGRFSRGTSRKKLARIGSVRSGKNSDHARIGRKNSGGESLGGEVRWGKFGGVATMGGSHSEKIIPVGGESQDW